jgi:hypothetical protein
MQLQAILWLFLPVIVAGGSAMLSYYIMQARMEVALAKEREALAEARAAIHSHKVTMEERIKATEEAAKRSALDDLMQDIRVEERSYVRDSNTAGGSRRSMVMQERVFFRNIPMSSWTEHEMLIEEGPANSLSERTDNMEAALIESEGTSHPQMTPRAVEKRLAVARTAQPASPSSPAARRDTHTLIAHAAFGTQ